MNDPPIAAVGDAGGPEAGSRLAGMRRILIGFDEGSGSRDALAFAKALCERTGAELIVASVRAYWSDLLGPEQYAQVLAEDEAWLRREAGKALGALPFSIFVVGGGDQAGGLKEIALAEGADLIVVGSTHRGRLGRVLPGSVGERVLDNAPCAVAVAPRGLAERELELHTIAVGYDGSLESTAALRLAGELAARAGADLLVLGAIEHRFDLAGLPNSPDEAEEARMRAHLERAREATPKGVAVETTLLHGPPHVVLADAAQRADLLVLGSRSHYGRGRRLFLGSVATAVTRSAPCPTLLTPADR